MGNRRMERSTVAMGGVFDLVLIEAAIGVVFIWFLTARLCSLIVERIASVLGVPRQESSARIGRLCSAASAESVQCQSR